MSEKDPTHARFDLGPTLRLSKKEKLRESPKTLAIGNRQETYAVGWQEYISVVCLRVLERRQEILDWLYKVN